MQGLLSDITGRDKAMQANKTGARRYSRCSEAERPHTRTYGFYQCWAACRSRSRTKKHETVACLTFHCARFSVCARGINDKGEFSIDALWINMRAIGRAFFPHAHNGLLLFLTLQYPAKKCQQQQQHASQIAMWHED